MSEGQVIKVILLSGSLTLDNVAFIENLTLLNSTILEMLIIMGHLRQEDHKSDRPALGPFWVLTGRLAISFNNHFKIFPPLVKLRSCDRFLAKHSAKNIK